MTESESNVDGAEAPGAGRRRRFRWPRLDFVAVMLIVLVLMLMLFFTAEMWLPHWGE